MRERASEAEAVFLAVGRRPRIAPGDGARFGLRQIAAQQRTEKDGRKALASLQSTTRGNFGSQSMIMI